MMDQRGYSSLLVVVICMQVTQSCIINPRPRPSVDGGWSKWKEGACSVSCGGGTQIDTRECNNPEPKNGGEPCSGNTTKTEECNIDSCPGGGLSCTLTKEGGPCGGGSGEAGNGREDAFKPIGRGCNLYDKKELSNDPESIMEIEEISNPNDCATECKEQGYTFWTYNYEEKKCIATWDDVLLTDNEDAISGNNQCGVSDGGWTDWTPGICTRTCGRGTKTDTRTCTKPEQANGGKPCDGEPTQIVPCTDLPACDGRHLCPDCTNQKEAWKHCDDNKQEDKPLTVYKISYPLEDMDPWNKNVKGICDEKKDRIIYTAKKTDVLFWDFNVKCKLRKEGKSQPVIWHKPEGDFHRCDESNDKADTKFEPPKNININENK